MSFKTYLILVSNVSRDSFLDEPYLEKLCKEGVAFNFVDFQPADPDTAITCLMTGAKPGNTVYLKAEEVFADAGGLIRVDKTLPSILGSSDINTASFRNSIPRGDGDFCAVAIDGLALLDKIIDSIKAGSSNVFIIAPVFHKKTDKAVNINTFLKELELIETDSQNNIVWENSLAYHTGNGQLWINLIGRDLKGTVLPGDEYEDVRNALVGALSKKLLDKTTGVSIVDNVYKKEELFGGTSLLYMPDLVVSLKEGYGFSNKCEDIIFDESYIMTGDYRSYSPGSGIIISDNTHKGLILDDLKISSVSAAILHLMGEKIPRFMTELDERIFTDDYMIAAPPQYCNDSMTTVITEDEESAIKERLRGLGYLD